MYALVDCNNFYASCERVFRPDLNGKPIVVLSNNDGCVIARSNEAKNLNIPMGAPAFKYKQFFKANNIHVFSSNYALYGDMSNRVMTLLADYSPDIEIYSIDESFLKLEGFDLYQLENYALEIKNTVGRSTGIPLSVGVAPTKTLAKVANRVVKKFQTKTKGVYIIDSEEKRIKALKWLKIEDVWGIGRRLSKRLHSSGVVTAYDFTQLSTEFVRTNFSVVGLRMQLELKGEDILNLEQPTAKQSISTTRTFHKPYTEYEDLNERIATFVCSASATLRKQRNACNLIQIFIQSSRFNNKEHQYNKSIVIKTDIPTNSSIDLVKYASLGLKQIFKENVSYKRAGIVLMGLVPENEIQLNLFKPDNPAHQKIMTAMDAINSTMGRDKVKLAVQDLGQAFKMNQQNLSKKYSTDIKDIITINV